MFRTLPLSLISGLLAGEASQWVRRTKRRTAFLAIAVLFGLTAWFLAVAAVVVAIADGHGYFAALVAGAIGLAAIALLAIAAMMVIDRMETRRLTREKSGNTALYAAAAAVALPTILRSRPLLLLGLAAGGAYLATLLLAGRRTPGDEDQET